MRLLFFSLGLIIGTGITLWMHKQFKKNGTKEKESKKAQTPKGKQALEIFRKAPN